MKLRYSVRHIQEISVLQPRDTLRQMQRDSLIICASTCSTDITIIILVLTSCFLLHPVQAGGAARAQDRNHWGLLLSGRYPFGISDLRKHDINISGTD